MRLSFLKDLESKLRMGKLVISETNCSKSEIAAWIYLGKLEKVKLIRLNNSVLCKEPNQREYLRWFKFDLNKDFYENN